MGLLTGVLILTSKREDICFDQKMLLCNWLIRSYCQFR